MTGVEASPGSVVNITGGTVDIGVQVALSQIGLNASSGSEVNISGGSFGRDFVAYPGSDVELIGGEFRLNGAPFSDSSITLNEGDVFSGTLSDGSVFIFSDPVMESGGDALSGVQLTSAILPTLDLSPVVVSTSNPSHLSGLRPGQTLTLQEAGELGGSFEVVNATLNVEGGNLGCDAEATNSLSLIHI